MKLSKEQIKIAKNLMTSVGQNPKNLHTEVSNAFYQEECNGTFEGYLSWLVNYKTDVASWLQMSERSHQNIMSGLSLIHI